MTVHTIEPPFDIESIHAAWRESNLTDDSPAIFYRRAVRTIRANRLSRKKCWPLDVAHPSANLTTTARYTGAIRRIWLDRGPRGWIPKCQKAIGLWREGSQKQLLGPIRLDDQIDPHNIGWLVNIAEVIGDRNERDGKTEWARELYLDFLRSANHLRPLAPLDQGRFACAVELRIGGELRRWAFAKQTTHDEIRTAIEELQEIWRRPVPVEEHFRAEYATWSKTIGDAAIGKSELPDEVLLGIQAGLLWFWELASQPIASRTRLLRQQQQVGGAFAMQPLITEEFCERRLTQHNRLGGNEPGVIVEHVKQQLAHAQVQAELARYTEAISYFDQCQAARAATRASLILAAYQKEKGYYPQELATACKVLGVEPPIDPYSQCGSEVRYLCSPGQRLKGMGIEWHRRKLRTRVGQPIIYSLGADGDDHRCTTVWNRKLTGRGDWAFPLQSTRSPRRWIQFDTRTVLAAFTLFAFIFGIQLSPPGRHRAAIVAIEALGGEVEYREIDSPDFVERWMGQKFGGEIVSITLSEKKDIRRAAHLLPYLQETETLDLSSTSLNAVDFEYIGQMRALTSINLDDAVFEPGHLHRLVTLEKLTEIDISDTNTNDYDIAALANCDGLTSICAARTKITGSGFVELSSLQSLETLGLIGSPITDAGLAGIGKLTGLTHLDLDSTPISGSGLHCLSGLNALATLDIRSTQIDDDGLKNLPLLPELQTVYAQNTQVRGPGLTAFAEQPNLSTIVLSETKITNDGLQNLSGSKSLSSLTLESCKLNDAGLIHLKEIESLTSLDLSDSALSEEAAKELNAVKNALQDLEIER